jgi:DNA-directed RNA polymerase specialized sigma24 family protein
MADDRKRGGPRGNQRGASPRAATGAKGAKGATGARPAPAGPDGIDERVAQLAAPLRTVLERLPATQRKVLELRMGLVDGHPQDPADAARTLGMSLAELREIEARAFERIREVIPLQQLQRFLER